MKREKRYMYPYKYIKYFYFDDNLNDDDMLSVINRHVGDSEYEVEIYNGDNIVYAYRDFGDTMEYLKGLGKIVTVAGIASTIPPGYIFDIDDSSICYGVSKLKTLNNDFIIFGGYENWSVMINIDGMSKESAKDKIIQELLNYRENYGFADLKKMYIRMHENVAAYLSAEIFSKPYIYIYK